MRDASYLSSRSPSYDMHACTLEDAVPEADVNLPGLKVTSRAVMATFILPAAMALMLAMEAIESVAVEGKRRSLGYFMQQDDGSLDA